MIELYKRLSRSCNTFNQLNRALLLLEKRMTPLELFGLRSDLRLCGRASPRVNRLGSFPKEPPRSLTANSTVPQHAVDRFGVSIAWIDELYRKFCLAGKHSPEPFMRLRLRHAVWTFRSDSDSTQKMLLICFTGNAQRLMMPLPVFLQHLDARTTDVAYLLTEKHAGYRKGIRGITDDLDTSIAALECLLNVRGYDRVAIIGTSGGGLPAILAGLQLGVDAVLSVGPNNPNDSRWTAFTEANGATDLFRRFSARNTRAPVVYLAYGAEVERDVTATAVIASCIEVRDIWSVPNAGHCCLYPLVQRGRFGDLLKSTICNWPAPQTRVQRN
jgi:hypothetical protein